MARASHMQTSFNGGELDPQLEGRIDLARYATSCRSMQNFIPKVEGPAEKRPGTRYVLDAFDHAKASRLIPFEFSRTQAYVLEFSEFRVRFYRNNGVVLETVTINTAVSVGATTTFTTTATHEWSVGDSVFVSSVGGTLGPRVNGRAFKITATPAGNQYTIAFNSTGLTASGDFGQTERIYELHTPYDDTEVGQIAYAQSADVLFIDHPNHFSRKLLRFGDNNWTLTHATGGQYGNEIQITSITNASPGVFTTATPHELATGDIVRLSKVQGMREVNGLLCRVNSAPTELTFTVGDLFQGTISVNTTAFHLDGAGGAGVSNVGVMQRLITHDWPAFAPENLNERDLVVVTSTTGTAGEHKRSGSSVRVFSSGGRIGSDLIGSYIKIREVFEESYTKWEARNNMSDDAVGGFPVGSHAHWEGRVYELINKNAQANTGTSPPVHEKEREQQLDHRWTWEFENFGDGFILITTILSPHHALGIVFKQLPLSCFDPTGHISSSAISNTLDPVEISVASTAALLDGELVLLSGFDTATELNGLLVYVDVFSGTQFRCFYDAGLTRGVDGINVGSGGEVTRFVKGQHRWSVGAWNSRNGNPRAVSFYEDRLVHAGTALQPQSLWLSATGQYESHDQHDLLTGGLSFTLNVQEMNAIEWLFARRGLALGTQGGEFIGTGQDPDKAVSAENVFRPFRMTSLGVRPGVRPVQYGNSILYVQRAGREVREFVPDTELVDEHVSNDISVLSSHLFGISSRIVQLALQKEPDPLIWAVLDDGSLVVCAYDRQQDVVAWAPIPIGGPSPFIPPHTVVGGGERAAVESIAVIPHPDGTQDQLWLVVQRFINGASVRHIERMEKPWETLAPGFDPATDQPFYVDAGLTYLGIPTSTLTGLDHLEGETVHMLADGVYRTAVVAGGAVSLGSVTAENVVVGLPIPEPTIFTQRLEFGGADGPAQGKFKRHRNVVLRLRNVGPGLHYGSVNDLTEMDRLPMTVGGDPDGSALTLIDGDTRELELPGDVDAEGRVCIKHVEPFACIVQAIIVQTSVEDD